MPLHQRKEYKVKTGLFGSKSNTVSKMDRIRTLMLSDLVDNVNVYTKNWVFLSFLELRRLELSPRDDVPSQTLYFSPTVLPTPDF